MAQNHANAKTLRSRWRLYKIVNVGAQAYELEPDLSCLFLFFSLFFISPPPPGHAFTGKRGGFEGVAIRIPFLGPIKTCGWPPGIPMRGRGPKSSRRDDPG